MKRKVWTTVLAMALFALFGGSIPMLGMSACAGPPWGGPTGGAATTTSNSTTSSTTGTTGTQSTSTPTECSAAVEEPCMRYKILLLGNPTSDKTLRDKYIAKFGDACYVADDSQGTFNCFYQKWQDACDDAKWIADVYGAAPYDKTHQCQPDGAGNYTLQIGPDVANVTYINYQAAPRQTPLTEVNGTPTAVNGPYRNLVQVATVEPGKDFYDTSGVPDGDGGTLTQQKWVLQVNRKQNGGKIRSDLAGFEWECDGVDGGKTTCKELDILEDPASDGGSPFYYDTVAQVHHVVPMKDLRCCPWGTNSYKNAAVISGKLNRHFGNNNPPAEEVNMLNDAGAYPP